jgi:hypothetical protein
LPFAKAGVDIHVSSSFPSQSVGDFSYMVPITYHLQSAEQEKCHGPSVNAASTFVNGKMVICALNDSNTILIPLLLIPLVALTPLPTYFLFGFDLCIVETTLSQPFYCAVQATIWQ